MRILQVCLLASGALASPACGCIDDTDFDEGRIIVKDVAIVGGGASGSHAAIRLREDFGQDIVVIEKKGRLGGHTETFDDPVTGKPYDYGVYSYLDFGPQSKAMFERFNIPIGGLNRTAQETIYADFTTGNLSKDYAPPPFPDVLQALQNYVTICEKYETMLLPDYDHFPEPDDIPEDLLMPFGEFAKKYKVEPAINQIFEVTGMGVGDMLNTPTMHVMQTFGAPLARVFTGGPNVFQPVSRNNSELYGKIADLLDDDIMYMSTVVESQRMENGVKLVVEGYDGSKTLIKAKKLLLAIEPTIENMAPFDMSEDEKSIFSKWIYTHEYVGIVQHPSLPFNTSIVNIPDSAKRTDLHALPKSPYQPRFDHLPGSKDLFSVIVVMDSKSTSEDAMYLVEGHLKNLITAESLPSAGTTEASMYPTIVAWGDHGPMHLHASNEEMKKGFIQKQYALQGGRSTYFTGAAWVGHFTTVVWEFNEKILPQLLKEDVDGGKHRDHGKHKGHEPPKGHGHGHRGGRGGHKDHGRPWKKPLPRPHWP